MLPESSAPIVTPDYSAQTIVYKLVVIKSMAIWPKMTNWQNDLAI